MNKFLSYNTTALMLRRVNGWFTVAWIMMVPISYYSGWLNSVVYVSALSLWALVTGHLSAWQAARIEYIQAIDADVDEVLKEVKLLREELRAAGITKPGA